MQKSVTKSNLTNELIIKICNLHFPNSDVSEIKELTQGMYNCAYKLCIDGLKYILKVAPSDSVKVLTYEKDIMKTEVDFCSLLSPKHVIIPSIIAFDNSREIVDKPYFIMNYLEGESLFNLRKKLTKVNSASIYRELGSIISNINSINGEYFGYPSGKHYNDMRSFYLSALDDILSDGMQIGLKRIINEKFMGIIFQASEEFNAVLKPSLVHFDIWEGNIFIKNNRISGIIDWERGFWGDSLGDFISMKFFAHPRTNSPFIKGYFNRDYVFNRNELIRISLLRIYLFCIVTTEGYYREIKNSYLLNKIFGRIMLYKELRNLRKLMRS